MNTFRYFLQTQWSFFGLFLIDWRWGVFFSQKHNSQFLPFKACKLCLLSPRAYGSLCPGLFQRHARLWVGLCWGRGGGADGQCCSQWGERGVKEARSANCSGSCKGCVPHSREREQGDSRHLQQNSLHPSPSHTFQTPTYIHTHTRGRSLLTQTLLTKQTLCLIKMRWVSLWKWCNPLWEVTSSLLFVTYAGPRFVILVILRAFYVLYYYVIFS